MKITKIYPSSAAFMVGDLVFAQYSSSCLRNQLLASEGVKEPFNPIHTKRGAIAEKRYEDALIAADADYEREVPFKIEIEPGVVVSGRVDFKLSGSRIDEIKSSESLSVIQDVIKDGNPKEANVAQLITYLMAESLTYGSLVYSAFKWNKKAQVYEHIADRVFSVQLMARGEIYVDEKLFRFHARDVVAHMLATARVIRNRSIASRPFNHKGFDGPCKRCAFATTCGLYDEGILESVDDFVHSAKNELLSKGKMKE